MFSTGLSRKSWRDKFGSEQRQAVKKIPLLDGKDVFGVLPTRFGKSLIYQSYAFARNVRDGRPRILVIIALRNIV